MARKKSIDTKEVKKDDRTRNWSFLVYPSKEYLDSIGSEYDGSDGYGTAPDDWRDIIDEEHIEWVESPLHDRDLDPNGNLKKPHWHILLLYKGKKSYEQIKEITDKLNAPIPQKVASSRGIVRYMAHLDNPDKFQYERSGIIGHGGVDVTAYLKITASNRYEMIKEMITYVNDHDVCEMLDMLNYAMEERFDDWFPLLCDSSAYIIDMAIKSNRHRAKDTLNVNKPSIVVNSVTGEVVDTSPVSAAARDAAIRDAAIKER